MRGEIENFISDKRMKTIINKKLNNIISAAFILLVSAVSVNSQFVQWTQTFGGPGQDGGESMVHTGNGETVITGFKSANERKDILLMKTNAQGNELWSRVYNTGINDIGRSVRQTADGGFVIAGMTEVSPQIFDPIVIKTDNAGNVQWQQHYDYGFGDDDRGHSVWQTSDGGYVVAGQTWLMHGQFGNYDMYIIKTDMNGNVEWKKVFFRQNEGGDVALSVQQLNDGGYIIGGFTHSTPWASYVIRTDNLGNAVWSNVYPGSWQSECYDIQPTPDGGFIFTGTESSFETDTDVLITKLDASGNLTWKKIYGTVDAEQGESILQLPDGGYIIAGMSSTETSSYDMYVIRTNSAGDSLWSRTIGGSSDDRAFSVVSPQAGSYIVTGWAWSYGQGVGDVYLVKLSELLTGNIGNNTVPGEIKLGQNYPNPFNPVTTISFGLTGSQNVTLSVYDITGKLVEQILNRNMSAGNYEISWNAANYPSGIYFYTLKTAGLSLTKKMMLIK